MSSAVQQGCLVQAGGAPTETIQHVHAKMADAVRAAARECLHDGEAILTASGDHAAAAIVFEEAEQLYRHIGDQDGAKMMQDRVDHEHRAGSSSGVCAIS